MVITAGKERAFLINQPTIRNIHPPLLGNLPISPKNPTSAPPPPPPNSTLWGSDVDMAVLYC